MVHVQAAHMINIYELGTDATNNNNNAITNNNNVNNIVSGIGGNGGGIVNDINRSNSVNISLNTAINEVPVTGINETLSLAKHDSEMTVECTEMDNANVINATTETVSNVSFDHLFFCIFSDACVSFCSVWRLLFFNSK